MGKRGAGSGEWASYEPGSLRHTVVIEQQIEISSPPSFNSMGEPVAAWSTFATVRANVQGQRGTEWYGKQQVMTTVYYEMVLRYSALNASITQVMRARWDGKVFNITDVHDADGRKRWLVAMMYEAL